MLDHVGRQKACVYSFLRPQCVIDAGLGAICKAIGDSPNNGPCPFSNNG